MPKIFRRLLVLLVAFYLLFSIQAAFSVHENKVRNVVTPVKLSHSSGRRYIYIIDGIIFALQGGQPKGISGNLSETFIKTYKVVWRNVIPHLAEQLSVTHDQLIFLDRSPQHTICKEIAESKHVQHVIFEDNLDKAIQSLLTKKGFSLTSAHESLSEENPIIVFMSTYYEFPSLPGLCNIIMYHDLIPENVGMYAGVGSEYWPRIAVLETINGVVSVSDSTSRDIIKFCIFIGLEVNLFQRWREGA